MGFLFGFRTREGFTSPGEGFRQKRTRLQTAWLQSGSGEPAPTSTDERAGR